MKKQQITPSLVLEREYHKLFFLTLITTETYHDDRNFILSFFTKSYYISTILIKIKEFFR